MLGVFMQFVYIHPLEVIDMNKDQIKKGIPSGDE